MDDFGVAVAPVAEQLESEAIRVWIKRGEKGFRHRHVVPR